MRPLWAQVYIIAVALLATPAQAALVVESGPGAAAGVSWSELQLNYRFGAEAQPGWHLRAQGVALVDPPTDVGDITLECPSGALEAAWPLCVQGRLLWRIGEEDALAGEFSSSRDAAGNPVLELKFAEPELVARIVLEGDDVSADISVTNLPLDGIAGPLAQLLSLTDLEGYLTATAQYRHAGSARLQASGQTSALAFDTPDGTLAAANVHLAFELELSDEDGGWHFDADLLQSDGEWLFGPVYIPAPEQPVRLNSQGVLTGNRLTVSRFELADPGVLSTAGSLEVIFEDEAALHALEVEALQMHLPVAQQRYLNGLLAAYALDDATSSGAVQGRMRVDAGPDGPVLAELDLRLDDVTIEEADWRFGVAGISGRVEWREADHYLEAALQWRQAHLHNIPVGGANLRLTSADGHLHLAEPLSVPVFDGALRVERLEWLDWRRESARLDLDAKLEPVDFAQLSLALGWPELGGSVSGTIPTVRFENNVLAFTGGIVIDAFSGRIDVRELAIERPFGSLPGLTAEIDFQALDLLEVTGAFGFGRMEGRLDGYIHDLRMLNWQPVAFDARLATQRVSGVRRRISQRAVDNLSSLGGGGGSVLTAPFLGFFENFSYRRVGLTCRLVNNVCHMGGVAEAADGGFYIVEGAGVPRLNIIGHRRLVDWPQLVRQLRAVTQETPSAESGT